MKNVTVIGLQWGDEGKGKVVDALAANCRYVARYCGGANAGHSVQVAAEKFALHLIPCGILHAGVTNVIGNGVAFDPATALEEIDALRARGVAVDENNFRISHQANLVMPWHKLQDTLSEKSLAAGKIGTTARGIGPCYADKANRSTALRAGDLLDEAVLREKIARIVEIKNRMFAALYDAEPMDAAAIADDCAAMARRLSPMVSNTGAMLRSAVADGQRILFEGGQGSLLDIDHGTFPFVTSSSVSACGVPTGTGVSPKAVGTVVGIAKAYTTRVGAGPFPTEQDNEIGNTIRERGREYGTTTGRSRRCGWLDAFALRYTAELSGVDEIALALLDVLSGLKELNICTGYAIDGETLDDFDPMVLDRVECIYETLPGWTEDISDCRSFDALPEAARNYVTRIEKIVGRPISFISVGPEREQTIVRDTQIKGLS